MTENSIREYTSRRPKQQRRRTKETMAAVVVIAAMLVCMSAVAISICFAGKDQG